MEFKTVIPREIIIKPTHNNGFIVQTGCCTLCFANKETLVGGLAEYLADPEVHEERYEKMQREQGTGAVQGTGAEPAPGPTGGLRQPNEGTEGPINGTPR